MPRKIPTKHICPIFNEQKTNKVRPFCELFLCDDPRKSAEKN